MKHLKKYKIFNENLDIDFDSMSDKDIEDRISELRVLIQDFNEELKQVFGEKTQRIENKQKEITLPENIFDLNEKQFKEVFGKMNAPTDFSYKRMSKYTNQLAGILNSGFSNKTNQTHFAILPNSDYNIRPMNTRVKSLEFLCKMLDSASYVVKRGEIIDDLVYFTILYNSNKDNHIAYFSKKENIFYYTFSSYSGPMKFTETQKLLEYIDKENKDKDEDY